jgi:Flp pilus assembly protein TadB
MKHRVLVALDPATVLELERRRRARALSDRMPSFAEVVRQAITRGLAVDTAAPAVVQAPTVIA